MPKGESLLGRVVDIHITSAGKHFLKGSIVSNVHPLSVPCSLPKGQISGLQDVLVVGCLFFGGSYFVL